MVMPLSSAADLVALLRDLGLVSPRRLRALAKAGRADRPAQVLARELVKRGWLTAFQADELLQGRGGELLLGQYVLLEKLGEGGMGAVYKARHTRLDRTDAVKVVSPHFLEQPKAVARFRREIEASARLSHPNIVAVYDAGEAGGRHFLAMEYVEGDNLAYLVKWRGPQAWPDVVRILVGVAQGLQHAHEQWLVHRDVKPANLLRAARTGQVKILDLGLACLREGTDGGVGGDQLTSSDAVMGTPDYMAPEQTLKTRAVDIRADLYSLGCTAYYLLAGHVPFPGGDALEKMLRQRAEQPEPLDHLRPDLPFELAAVVAKLMAKDPAERFQTPADLAASLLPLLAAPSRPGRRAFLARLAGKPTPTLGAPSLPATVPAPPPSQGRPVAPARGTALTARRLLVAGLLVAGLAAVLALACPCLLGPPAATEPTGSWVVATPTSPATTKPAEPSWKCVDTILRGSDAVFGVAFSPNGRLLAAACGDYEKPLNTGFIYLYDRDRGENPIRIGSHKVSARFVAFTNDDTVPLVSATGAFKVDPKFQNEVVHWGPAWAQKWPDPLRLGGPGDATGALAPRHDSKAVLVSLKNVVSTVAVAYQGTGEFSQVARVTALAVSRDGGLIANGLQDGALLVHKREYTKKKDHPPPFPAPPGREGRISGLAFRNEDAQLVGTTYAPPGENAEIRLWKVAVAPGKVEVVVELLLTIRHGPHDILATALSCNGQLLATGTGEGIIRVWNLNTGKPEQELTGHVGAVYSLAFAADGTLASGGHDGTVRLWQRK
jgi:serine/threonine-protein kinase